MHVNLYIAILFWLATLILTPVQVLRALNITLHGKHAVLNVSLCIRNNASCSRLTGTQNYLEPCLSEINPRTAKNNGRVMASSMLGYLSVDTCMHGRHAPWHGPFPWCLWEQAYTFTFPLTAVWRKTGVHFSDRQCNGVAPPVIFLGYLKALQPMSDRQPHSYY